MHHFMNISKRFLNDVRIILMYRLKKVEKEHSSEEVDIDYFLYKRWEAKDENQRSVTFAFTTIENVTGELMLWIHELQVIRDQDKGKGLGSYLIRQIIKNATKRQLPVALFADPGGAGGIRFNQEELTNWYARYGFVKEGGVMIKRL